MKASHFVWFITSYCVSNLKLTCVTAQVKFQHKKDTKDIIFSQQSCRPVETSIYIEKLEQTLMANCIVSQHLPKTNDPTASNLLKTLLS